MFGVLQNEPELLAMLGEVRQGLLTPQTRKLLARLQRPLPTDDGILPTELLPKNKLVRVQGKCCRVTSHPSH